MRNSAQSHSPSGGPAHLERRVDKMLAAGRLTEDEATRLRSTSGSDDFDDVVGQIRSRHIKERIDQALEAGEMTRAEADGLLEQVRRGADPRSLASLRRTLRHRSTQRG